MQLGLVNMVSQLVQHARPMLALAAALTWHTQAMAVPPLATAPELASLSQSNAKVIVDVRKFWQASVIGVNALPPNQASNPEELWSIPDAEFKAIEHPKRFVLSQGQRYVARLNMTSTGFGTNMNLSLMMPRLDAVNLAYRYYQEPWVQASAGDLIAMNKWAYSDRQPSFDIPLRPGNLNLVMEIAHQGVVDAPMVLQSVSSYRDDRLLTGLGVGLLVGVNLVLGLIGIAASMSFRRTGFLAIPLMTLLMAMVVTANSGMAGIYLFNTSDVFNDEVKFFTTTAWCVALPWVTVVALSLRHRIPRLWVAAMVWAIAGVVLAWLWKDYGHRSTALLGVPVIVMSTILFCMGILAYAVLRNENQALATAPGVLLYASAIFIPLLAYFGHLGNDESIFYSAIATMVAALLFLQTLLRQHRQGRLVMSRAQTSPNRDVLTGLLNRKGFENALAHNVKRMKSERAYAIFLYVRLGGTGDLRRDYGEEGFDAAMVQLAAALSSSVTVVDTVARVASDAFAINVLMPRDAKLANLLAQKILTRTMTLATHSAPMAQTARISLAWMPMFGIVLDDLERRSLRALRKMQDGKRITWVGGDQAQAEMSLLTEGLSGPTTRPHNGLEPDDLPSLPGMIDRIEEEMLGPDPLTLQIEADRLLRELRQKEKSQPA